MFNEEAARLASVAKIAAFRGIRILTLPNTS